MTRKDYIKIADVLHFYKEDILPPVYQDLVYSFCLMLANDNPRFDWGKFRRACGLGK